MKIALIGYGNMGQKVERVLSDGKHKIVSVSFKNKKKLDKTGIKWADVAIDFTSPSVVLEHIEIVSRLGVNMVVGTTGWYNHLEHVKKVIEKNKTGLIYGSNFSVGGNIFFQIVKEASLLFHTFGGYDVGGYEIHHTGKKDSPSGTAKKIGSIIMENFPTKKKLETGRLNRKIEQDELHFASLRVGGNFGHHSVIFDSAADQVTLTHTAHGRQGFAEGAILAAEFIEKRKGIFTFEELFSNMIKI
jgi:4-hydroxy-tetrahydrodipicolinate reductase